jgi:mannan endo-1,4-beta-mannosidase
MRAWTMIDRGSLDGSVPNVDGPGHKDGYYMQYWDAAAGRPAINDTESGLKALDHMLASAAAHNVKVIMVLTNNWRDFGGMDQYVKWKGGQYHDEFYTDTTIKGWYKNWAATLINRTNTITGVRYKDDPAIFSWELANEPRCSNANLSTSGSCTTQTIVNWAAEMSTYINGLDGNHMISVGDEGFLNWNRSSDWTYNAGEGVDHEALTRLPNVDFGTYHLYPSHWGKDAAWGTQWIRDHNTAAAGFGKPSILEEFGHQDQGGRDAVYQTWTDAVRTGGGDGWNAWILTGVQDDGSLYPDYDGFRFIYPSSTATVLKTAADAIAGTVDPTPTTTGPSASASPSRSPSSSPSASPSSSSSPPPAGACTVRYNLSDWGSSFNGDVTIRNTGTSAVNGWTLRWTFPGNQVVTNMWNAVPAQSGKQVTATNPASYNTRIPAGGSLNFGFSGTSVAGTNGVPASFTLNGVTCAKV